ISRSPELGIIADITRTGRVIDRLPARDIMGRCAKGRHGLPVTFIDPLLDQLAALPVEPLLMPDLRLPVFKRCKDACLELHENIVSVRQWRLVVDEQIAALIGGRSRGVRIINNVTEHRIEALSDQVYEPRMLWVFAPLSPTKVSTGLCRRD